MKISTAFFAFCLLLATFICSESALAQNQTLDVVYLTNGSVMRGKIEELVPGQQTRFRTTDGNLFVFDTKDIAKIEKEEVGEKQGGSILDGISSRETFGLGYAVYGNNIQNFIKFRITESLVNKQGLSLGLGLGIHYQNLSDQMYLPVMATLGYHAAGAKGSLSPAVMVTLGYSFDAKSKLKSIGYYLNPAVGACYKVGDQSELSLMLGWDYQAVPGNGYGFFSGMIYFTY